MRRRRRGVHGEHVRGVLCQRARRRACAACCARRRGVLCPVSRKAVPASRRAVPASRRPSAPPPPPPCRVPGRFVLASRGEHAPAGQGSRARATHTPPPAVGVAAVTATGPAAPRHRREVPGGGARPTRPPHARAARTHTRHAPDFMTSCSFELMLSDAFLDFFWTILAGCLGTARGGGGGTGGGGTWLALPRPLLGSLAQGGLAPRGAGVVSHRRSGRATNRLRVAAVRAGHAARGSFLG